jgi:hypothetical protein
MTKNKKLVVKGKNGERFSSRVEVGHLMERIYERTSITVGGTGTGVASATLFNVSPAGLISASRLSGYQALRDDVRIDRVRVTLRPTVRGTCTGRCALYVERDPTEPLSATVPLAMDQFELCYGNVDQELVLEWRPQEPLDLEFQPLNPGTSVLAAFNLVADTLTAGGLALGAASVIFSGTAEVWATLRGRPN